VERSDTRHRPIDAADRVMDATLILIDSDAEPARARTLVDRLWESDVRTRLGAAVRAHRGPKGAPWPVRTCSTAPR